MELIGWRRRLDYELAASEWRTDETVLRAVNIGQVVACKSEEHCKGRLREDKSTPVKYLNWLDPQRANCSRIAKFPVIFRRNNVGFADCTTRNSLARSNTFETIKKLFFQTTFAKHRREQDLRIRQKNNGQIAGACNTSMTGMNTASYGSQTPTSR